MTRKPVVANQFYPGNPESLKKQIEEFSPKVPEKERCLGVMAPHAGYVYSGMVAGRVYASVHIPQIAVVISPNHTGLGSRGAIMIKDSWETPLGKVTIEGDIASKLASQYRLIEEDSLAHSREHSLEVQLPFLQYHNPSIKLVPLTLMDLSLKECEQLGGAVVNVLKGYSSNFLLVASSDMSHFEPQETAEKKDKMAINQILNLDAEGLLKTVRDNRISMCGVIPTTVMLLAAKELGAKEARLVKYSTSGDINRDYSSVVGYAGVIIK